MKVHDAPARVWGAYDPGAQLAAFGRDDVERFVRNAIVARSLCFAASRVEREAGLDPAHQQRQRGDRDDQRAGKGGQASPHLFP
jgi:hypothetical protein